MKRYLFFIFVSGVYISCGNSNSQNLSPVAKNYIDEVINLLQHNSINKYKINREDFQEDIYRHAKDSKTIENTYPSILRLKILYKELIIFQHHLTNFIERLRANARPW